MNMEYKLLDDNTGIILTRNPEKVSKNLFITFTGAPADATVIFENREGDSLYRKLEDNMCAVPTRFLCPILEDVIKVTVCVLDGVSKDRWKCEEIKTGLLTSTNEVLIQPNDMNIPQQMIELKLEIQEMRENAKKQQEEISELNNKLNRLLEGYDIT